MALEIKQSIFSSKHPLICQDLCGYGLVQLAKKEYAVALKYFQFAMKENFLKLEDVNIFTDLNANNMLSKEIFLDALIGQAETLEQMYMPNN